MKIAVYIRVSTDRQVEHGDSMENQLKAAKKWCKQGDHEIVKIYEEGGSSAFHDTRRIFKEMLVDVRTGEVDVDGVLVYSLSRFSRKNLNRMQAEELLSDAGVKLYSVTEPIAEGNEDMALVQKGFIGLMNELQSVQNRRAVMDAMDENARQGFHNGQTTPYGYRRIETDVPGRSGFKKRLGIDSEAAPVAKKIFSLAQHGDSGQAWGLKRIATYLNENGYEDKGKKWNINKVGRMLRNPVYKGTYVWGRDRKPSSSSDRKPVVVSVPAIIDEEVFSEVQSGMNERKVTNLEFREVRSKSPLTGLMRCGICGSSMQISTGKGGRYKYYKCSKRLKYNVNSCTSPTLPKEKVEAAVLSVVQEKFLDPERIAGLMDSLYATVKRSTKVYRTQLLRIERERTQKETSLKSLYGNFTESGFEPDKAFTEVVDSLRRRIRNLDREIEELKSRLSLPVKRFGEEHIEKFTRAMHEIILEGNDESTKAYLRAVISKITVNQKELVVRGSSVQLAGAISEWTPDTQLPRVPIVVTKWRAWHDSNVRPPGS
jgi:site-specific DNA recombinase